MTSESYLHPHFLSGGDPRGVLWVEGDRLYRGIAEVAESDMRELLTRGVFERLAEQGLIPRTHESNRKIAGYSLVLEHEMLLCITYAHEWTYTMLQDAALLVLKVRDALIAYGFDLADAHCDNVTFHLGRPIWLDIGSFIRNPNPRVWVAERRYRQSFLYPLQIWRRSGDFVGRRLFAGAEYLPREAVWASGSQWAQWLSPATLRKMSLFLDSYAAIAGATTAQLHEKTGKLPLVGRMLKALPFVWREKLFKGAGRGMLLGQRCSTVALSRKIRSLKKRGYRTTWEEYHSGVLREVSSFDQYPRFQRVLWHLKKLQPRTVTEIGANQGALSLLIQKDLNPDRMVCLDIDDGALDQCYIQTRSRTLPFYHAVLDTMRPFGTQPKLWPEQRLRSEALVALAVTHHMVLGQCNSVEYVLRRMATFTSRWILVEYMPWGLSTTPPATPVSAGYSAERFDRAFRTLFDLVEIEKLEPTRVLYVGLLRESARTTSSNPEFLPP